MSKKKDQLLLFIDQKAFNVILGTDVKNMPQKERNRFRFLQRKTRAEQKKFHSYGSAEEIKENFLENVRSKPAHKLNNELENLHLPTLPELEDDFVALCDKLGV